MDRKKGNPVVRCYATTRESELKLIELAKKRKTSVSEVIRNAVEEYLQKASSEEVKAKRKGA
jgi:hypothetical protein